MNTIPMKEDAWDVAVKRRLWEASQRELMYFAGRCAEEHVVGTKYSKGQQSVTAAARAKGYPAGLVRKLAALKRRGLLEGERASLLLDHYRRKLRLHIGAK